MLTHHPSTQLTNAAVYSGVSLVTGEYLVSNWSKEYQRRSFYATESSIIIFPLSLSLSRFGICAEKNEC
jgi:hypothetical protein